MRKLLPLAACCAASILFASPATAAPTITFDGVAGTFGNPEVNTATFDDLIEVVFGSAGTANFTISTNYTALNQDIDFTSVMFGTMAQLNSNTGVEFTVIDPTEPSQYRALDGLAIADAGTYFIRVRGDAGNGAQNVDASYSGTINFTASAVPEPATWAMFLMGFGVVGYSMRSRKVAYKAVQAV
jgi:hypothetical protein